MFELDAGLQSSFCPPAQRKRFRGVALEQIVRQARPLPTAGYVSFVARSAGGHHTSLPLAEAIDLGTLVALEADGQPLTTEHGGPVRTVTPDRYFYKSLKWLERIDFLSQDRVGTWEAGAGYHNMADPWLEQRYIATGLSKQIAAALAATLNISGQELLGFDVERRDLAGLQAPGALLRNANFRGCKLDGADFTGANLTNARMDGASLVGAKLVNASLEGTSFCGADLSDADLRGSSLIAATFCGQTADGQPAEPWARFSAGTKIDRSSLDGLMPVQQQFLSGQPV